MCVPNVYARFTVSMKEAKGKREKGEIREKLSYGQATRENTSEPLASWR